MENASKALLMAAGVLIGITVLSLAVYLYLNFSGATLEMEKQMEVDQINNFNNQFLTYNDKTELTIYDVYTVANLAEENNKKYDLETEGSKDYNYYVSVDLEPKVGAKIFGIEKNKLDYTEFIDKYMYVSGQEHSKDVWELSTFKCKVTINEYTTRVNKVVFTQN